MTEPSVLLDGFLPEPSVIVCRDEKAALLIQAHIHEDWARRPNVVISENWPENWHVNAVVMTPIKVLGTDAVTSFSISGDKEISENARAVINAYITLGRVNPGPKVSYRELAIATHLDRRTIGRAVKELGDAGIGTYKYGEGFELDLGRWLPDARKAEALGIKIEEYRV